MSPQLRHISTFLDPEIDSPAKANLLQLQILLDNHKLFETADPAVARANLERAVGTTHFDLASKNNFFFRANVLKLNDLSFGSYYDKSGTHVGFAAEDVARQLICIRGGFKFEIKNKSANASPEQWSTLVPRNENYKLFAAPGSSLLSMRIEQAAIRRKIEAATGEAINGDIQFDNVQNVDTHHLKSLRRTILHFATELSSKNTEHLSLAMQEIQQILIVGFIFSHRHNFSDLLTREHLAAPAHSQLQKVEEYIRANWDKAITIEDLSQVAYVSARSLFRSFKTWKGVSPMAFVKELRLKRSKELLETAAESTTVFHVALKCGFQSHGHFSRDYRTAFGEMPSETINRTLHHLKSTS